VENNTRKSVFKGQRPLCPFPTANFLNSVETRGNNMDIMKEVKDIADRKKAEAAPANANPNDVAKKARFIRLFTDGIVGNEIWLDRETGVNYLFHHSGTAGGFTPLLGADGKVVISTADVEEATPSAVTMPEESQEDIAQRLAEEKAKKAEAKAAKQAERLKKYEELAKKNNEW
jgi:hypothetical protein